MAATSSVAVPVRHRTALQVKSAQLGIGLYALTLLLELPGVLFRYILVAGFFWIISKLTELLVLLSSWSAMSASSLPADAAPPTNGGIIGFFILLLIQFTSVAQLLAHIIGWGPLVLSLASFILRGGNIFRRYSLGARVPSTREHEAVKNAIDLLIDSAPQGLKLRMMQDFFILDSPDIQQQATVIGSTVYFTRGLVRAQNNLLAALAHSLGHLNSLDGKLTLALRRLVLPPVYLLSRALKQLAPGVVKVGASAAGPAGCLAGGVFFLCSAFLSLAGGGFGVFVLSPLWAWYWQQRTFAADAFAADLGQSGNLITYLETFQGSEGAVPYLLSETPAAELRIDRLTNPDLYANTDLVDLRPYAIGLFMLVVVVCGVPWIGNMIAGWRV